MQFAGEPQIHWGRKKLFHEVCRRLQAVSPAIKCRFCYQISIGTVPADHGFYEKTQEGSVISERKISNFLLFLLKNHILAVCYSE